MVSHRIAAPGLLLSLAASALADCSISATTTIESEADASALSSCTTFSGSIAIATHVAGNISLDNIKTITGSLIAENVTELTRLSGDSLEEIEEFRLEGLWLLNTLEFPHLTSVNGIRWTDLTNLSTLSFGDGISKTSQVDIQNTSLNSLVGLSFEEVTNLYVSNNRWLMNFELPLRRVTNYLILRANSDELAVTLDDLQWAYNLTIKNARTISLPSLTRVNSSIGVYDTNVDKLVLDNLEFIGGALAIGSNADLTEVSIPTLNKCTYFYIDHNPQLKELAFDAVTRIGGALQISGNLSSVSLSSLSNDSMDHRWGGFALTSSQDGLDCSRFDALHEDGLGNGTYFCAGGCADPADADTCGSSLASPSATATIQDSSNGSDSLKASVCHGMATFGAFVLGTVVYELKSWFS